MESNLSMFPSNKEVTIRLRVSLVQDPHVLQSLLNKPLSPAREMVVIWTENYTMYFPFKHLIKMLLRNFSVYEHAFRLPIH